MPGSLMPLDGLLARTASFSSKDSALELPGLRGVLTTWVPLFLAAFLITGYLTDTLRNIPWAVPQGRWGWLRNPLNEPKAPEVQGYINATPNKGLLRYAGVLGQQRLHITNREGFGEVLQEKSYIFHKWDVTKRVLGPLMGDGLLLQEDDPHKIQRKKLGPSFAPRYIKELHPIFWSKTADLISILARDAEKGPINISVWAARATFDIISLATFGGDVEMLQNPDSAVSKAYGTLFSPETGNQTSALRSTLGVITPRKLLQALPLERNKEISVNNKVIRAWCIDCIRHEKALMKAGNYKESLNIINVAIRDNPAIDEELLTDQLMTILVAGHETSSHSLSWALWYLAKNPSVQEKVRAEVRTNLPPLDGQDSFETANLERLPFLQAVAEETIRLRPVVPILYRQTSEPTSVLGQPLPTGTVVSLSPWAINRDESLWGKDAATWNPDRWMGDHPNPAKGKNGSKYTFSSFSHGPRQCLGINFARAHLAALLAGVVGSFEITPSGKADPELRFGLVTLKPGGGIKVGFRRLPGF